MAIMSINEMASAIHAACMGIAGDKNDQLDAQQALGEASKRLEGSRLTICANVAKLSTDNDWDEESLDAAVQMAKKLPGSNNAQTKNAVGVFCSQVKVCAMPRVRAYFPTLASAIELAWDAETTAVDLAKAAKEDRPPTPLRDFVSRKYELILTACRRINDGDKLILDTTDDVIAWAKANDPSKDAERVAKRIRALAQQLHEFYQEFPHSAIMDAKKSIGSVKASDLVRARAPAPVTPVAPTPQVPQAQESAPQGAPTLASERATTPDAVQAQQDEREPKAGEPAEGVFDAGAMLNDPPAPVAQLQLAA